MTMNNLTIYLAGKMSGLKFEEMNMWRILVKQQLRRVSMCTDLDNLKIINPVDYFNFEEKRYKSELEVMKYDLSRVKNSDLVIVNLEGLDTSIGTIIECYEAYCSNIPVLAFGYSGDYEKLHPWIKCCITRYDNTYEECVEYVRDFYMR